MVWNTGCTSDGERAMASRISAVAACWSSASLSWAASAGARRFGLERRRFGFLPLRVRVPGVPMRSGFRQELAHKLEQIERAVRLGEIRGRAGGFRLLLVSAIGRAHV